MMSLLLSLTCALLGVLAVAGLLPSQAHAMRRRVLLVGMVVLICLPALRWLASSTDVAVRVDIESSEVEEVAVAVSQTPMDSWFTLVMPCWTLGTCLMLLRLFIRWRGMQALVRVSEDAGSSLPLPMQRLFSGRRSHILQPQVRISAGVATACVALWKWRPVILLPEQAIAWRASTLRAVLRHELEHAKRGDLWWRLAGEFALALWWWHPLAHVVVRRWTEACEQVCDDAVLKSGVRPESYARSLLALAGGSVIPTAAPAMAFLGRSPSRLRRRVASILSHHGEGSANFSWVACVAIGILAVILVFAATVHVQREDAARHAELQTEAQVRLEANPFPADP
jgi:beta-lactamase regulating signal transducer with metallopeptidase domain